MRTKDRPELGLRRVRPFPVRIGEVLAGAVDEVFDDPFVLEAIVSERRLAASLEMSMGVAVGGDVVALVRQRT